ncbi:hypothetical protein H6P81_012127 [Aristolochia fimbriata]|uniref:Uncharacterized protein n=1 Tax=Aristolochia fimbriata TaxID=158543 RepID=A0AAV7EBB3_ARIFI|nr:hypothetical protein H6P81_012127 [Aristolochia fimbriata]
MQGDDSNQDTSSTIVTIASDWSGMKKNAVWQTVSGSQVTELILFVIVLQLGLFSLITSLPNNQVVFWNSVGHENFVSQSLDNP